MRASQRILFAGVSLFCFSLLPSIAYAGKALKVTMNVEVQQGASDYHFFGSFSPDGSSNQLTPTVTRGEKSKSYTYDPVPAQLIFNLESAAVWNIKFTKLRNCPKGRIDESGTNVTTVITNLKHGKFTFTYRVTQTAKKSHFIVTCEKSQS